MLLARWEITLVEGSSALIHEARPLGAHPVAGCGPVAVEAASWGKIKRLFR